MFDLFRGRGSNLKATRASTTYLFNCFTFLGINQVSRWKPLYTLYAAIVNLTVMVLLPLSFGMSYFMGSDQLTTSQLLTSLQVAINVCGVPAKSITLRLSLKRFRKAEVIMATLDERCHRKEELNKIRDCIMMGNRLAVFYCCAYFLYAGSAFSTSTFMGHPPYAVYMPNIDWRKTKREFRIQALIEYMVMNVTCVHQAVDDAYGTIFIYIIRTHVQILVERVQRLGQASSKDMNYKELVECIKDHQRLLSLLDVISPVISVTVFAQFLIMAAILGITMINMFIFGDTSAQIASGVYFLAVLLQTTPCCYQATCLVEDGDQLPLAILQCNWMEEDQRFRKMLIFFMQRSQKSMSLTAMKLFPITLNTNLGVAKFSFSLYTLIKEMDFGQNLKK